MCYIQRSVPGLENRKKICNLWVLPNQKVLPSGDELEPHWGKSVTRNGREVAWLLAVSKIKWCNMLHPKKCPWTWKSKKICNLWVLPNQKVLPKSSNVARIADCCQIWAKCCRWRSFQVIEGHFKASRSHSRPNLFQICCWINVTLKRQIRAPLTV